MVNKDSEGRTWLFTKALRAAVRCCEVGLLAVGCLGLLGYGVSLAASSLYQQITSRQFDEAVRRTKTGAPALSGIFSLPDLSTLASLDPSEIPVSNAREWSPSKLRVYRRLMESPAPPALARLQIPSVGLSVMVLEGTDSVTLNRGVGHIEGTARPGEPGNVGLAGHRDSFFRCLDRIAANDEIILTTPEGLELRYVVDDISILEPDHVEVLDPTPNSTLTLITCYPFYYVGSAPLRFVVRALLPERPDERPDAAGLLARGPRSGF